MEKSGENDLEHLSYHDISLSKSFRAYLEYFAESLKVKYFQSFRPKQFVGYIDPTWTITRDIFFLIFDKHNGSMNFMIKRYNLT